MKETDTLKQIVLEALKEGVKLYCEKEAPNVSFGDLRIRIEYSREESFGDYSTSFALENSKLLGKKPLDSAALLVGYLQAKTDLFEKVDFTPPGFVNFRISPSFLIRFSENTIQKNDIFPKLENPKKVNLEFVSANPTGPLNIVSARAAATGEAFANLLKAVGHSVDKEFYVNDYGNQVFLLGVSTMVRIRETLGESSSIQENADDGRSIEELLSQNVIPAEGYRGDYLNIIAKQLLENPNTEKEIKSHLDKKEYSVLAEKCSRWTVESNLIWQKKDLDLFGVNFDRFFSETTLHESGKVLGVLENLKKSGKVFEEEGKQIFRSEDYGDDKNRVVVRDDGRPTYLLADIAYHNDKISRGYEKIIDIWGPDHHGYIARLTGAVQALGYPKENFQVIIAQQVNLLMAGQKMKMSKRAGEFQTMEDLLGYLGKHAKDVARYFFTMRSLDSPLDFDLDLAKDESDKNPVFYLQYAHARVCSIFREVGTHSDAKALENLEMTEERKRLLFWISRFPEEVLDAAATLEPHRIANYLQNLARAFTQFYIAKNNRLKDSDESTRLGLARICQAVRIVLAEGLALLGVSAPERLEKEN
ncbi:arginine--tRNA ligase [Leptospira licerasiae]|uniref:Arginine--tRNA ligase n=1 Tax=Leptospira licerasiae str. MMD4847 TaxID=1049971 RepID=A0ABN0H957_9LEPT|nr:arginine--tRNA ligase [Leptospira licerasiae]EIE00125.1 arginine--tRNA ligase [Leptospira licerasiae serovar Varillal str. VAR 010]EJZ42053.1 arginine--tRNA ligase [Leptospira licerasiae str. MMD4847]